MSLLVVFSTLSFTVEKHFCGDNLVDVALFSEVKKCGMEMTGTELPVKKPCCKDDITVVKGQDDLKLDTKNDLNDLDLNFVKAFVQVVSLRLYESLAKKTIPHHAYSPPNIVKDIQLLDDVFLI